MGGIMKDPVAERIMNYKPKVKAPPDFNRLVESNPNAFKVIKVGSSGSAREKQDGAEEAKV
jgi:hypothetical protein